MIGDHTRKEFDKRKARMKDAILHDPRLSKAERRIGYEIADHLNYRSGDAWPSQAHLANRTGYSEKTIERATKRLAGFGDCEGIWFSRELDGRGYRYLPKFEALDQQPDTRQNVGYRRPTLPAETPDIGDQNTRHGVGLSSLREPSRYPTRGFGTDARSSPRRQRDAMADRDEKVPIAFTDRDAEITSAASAGGAPRFVFEHSEPWRAWVEYRERNGIPGTMPTRQRMINGRCRIGWDVPTLWPPGYGRVKAARR